MSLGFSAPSILLASIRTMSVHKPLHKCLDIRNLKASFTTVGSVRYTRYRVQRFTHESVGCGGRLSNAIIARIGTQSREAQAVGIQKGEESGSGGEEAGVRRMETKWEVETLAD